MLGNPDAVSAFTTFNVRTQRAAADLPLSMYPLVLPYHWHSYYEAYSRIKQDLFFLTVEGKLEGKHCLYSALYTLIQSTSERHEAIVSIEPPPYNGAMRSGDHSKSR